jgi:hypothetical protein
MPTRTKKTTQLPAFWMNEYIENEVSIVFTKIQPYNTKK